MGAHRLWTRIYSVAQVNGGGRDPNYSIGDFHSLDLHSCALDALCYFIVGRWWKRKGVDRWNVFAPMVLGLILFSAVGAADIAHYSISLFAIKCLWPPAVVVAAAVLCIAVIVIVCLHVRAAWRDGLLLGRCIEIAATALIFVLPVFRHPSFHLPSLVLDLANRQYAREPGRVVVSGSRRVPLGRLFERYCSLWPRRPARLQAPFTREPTSIVGTWTALTSRTTLVKMRRSREAAIRRCADWRTCEGRPHLSMRYLL